MRWTELRLRTAWAFWIEYDVNPRHRTPLGELIRVRVPFNCYAEPIPIRLVAGAQSVWLAKEAPGAEIYHPDYTVIYWPGAAEYPGIMIDIRTLDMMKGGCCPETLLEEWD